VNSVHPYSKLILQIELNYVTLGGSCTYLSASSTQSLMPVNAREDLSWRLTAN